MNIFNILCLIIRGLYFYINILYLYIYILDTASHIESTWTVQHNSEYGFSSIACDQTIEQTLNRDSKTSGGVVGFTLDRSTMHKWIVCHAEKAAIVNTLQGMTSLENANSRYDYIL